MSKESGSKYATIDKDLGGMDYRSIAEKLSADGDQINHASTRSTFLGVMEKIAAEVQHHFGEDYDAEEVTKIAKHPSFQAAIQDVLHDHLTK